MASDDRERHFWRDDGAPLNRAELDVILQLRALVRAFQLAHPLRLQRLSGGYNTSNFPVNTDIGPLSDPELYVLYKLRHGVSIESELVKNSLYELMASFGDRVSRKDSFETSDVASSDALNVDFATAAALCVIEAVQQSRPSQPMSAEERNRAMEGTLTLRDLAREARADLR